MPSHLRRDVIRLLDGWEERPSITLKGKGAVVTLYAPPAHDALMDAAADGWRPPDV